MHIIRDIAKDSLVKHRPFKFDNCLQLEAKRSYKAGEMWLSVYGFLTRGGYGNQPTRVRLEGAIVPSNTPKEEWTMQLEAMVRLVAARYQSDFHLRAKINR